MSARALASSSRAALSVLPSSARYATTSTATPSTSDAPSSSQTLSVPSSPPPVNAAIEPTRGRLRRFLDTLSSGSAALTAVANQGAVKPSEQREGRARQLRQRPGVVASVVDKGLESEDTRLYNPEPKYTRSYRAGEHKSSTANFKIGPRKLDLLSRLIRRLPVDQALLQLEYSDKAHARRVRSMLVQAKQHAVQYKQLDPRKMIVDETWVTKGKILKRIDMKAKAGRGIRLHKASRLHVILREGPSAEEVTRRRLEREFKIRMRTGPTPFAKETRAIGSSLHAGMGWRW